MSDPLLPPPHPTPSSGKYFTDATLRNQTPGSQGTASAQNGENELTFNPKKDDSPVLTPKLSTPDVSKPMEGEDKEEKSKLSPLRYSVVGLACLGFVILYSLRTNVAIVAVTILDVKSREKVGTLEAMLNLPNLNWDPRMIGFLHGIFFIGNLLTHIPGGYLAKSIPCHWLYGGSIVLSSILNLLMPSAMESLRYPYVFSCLVRFLQGISEGIVYPALYGLLRHWSTPGERGRLGATVLTGAYGGAIVGFPLGGFVTHYYGWQYVFYANGALGIIWWIIWVLASSEKPSHSRHITESELIFLHKAQGDAVIDYANEEVPWRKILTSLPVLAICVCHLARNWVFVLMQTNEPYYLSLFDFNIAENGLYSSIPHIAKVVLSLLSGLIADGLMHISSLTTTHVRKLITGLAFGVQTLAFFALTFLTEGARAIVVLTVAVSFGGFGVSGWQINHYDLSTRHASVLIALTQSVGEITAIAVPILAGFLVYPQATFANWNIIFDITAAITAITFVLYLIFGSGEQQSWAVPPEEVRLVQKSDPLAKRPYSYFLQQTPPPPSPDHEGTQLMSSASRSYGTESSSPPDDLDGKKLD